MLVSILVLLCGLCGLYLMANKPVQRENIPLFIYDSMPDKPQVEHQAELQFPASNTTLDKCPSIGSPNNNKFVEKTNPMPGPKCIDFEKLNSMMDCCFDKKHKLENHVESNESYQAKKTNWKLIQQQILYDWASMCDEDFN